LVFGKFVEESHNQICWFLQIRCHHCEVRARGFLQANAEAEKEPKFRDNAISFDLKGTFGSSAARR